MNVEIGTEVAQLPEKKYINGIVVAACLVNPHGDRRRIEYRFAHPHTPVLESTLQAKLYLPF
jgi:hypothetical protein